MRNSVTLSSAVSESSYGLTVPGRAALTHSIVVSNRRRQRCWCIRADYMYTALAAGDSCMQSTARYTTRKFTPHRRMRCATSASFKMA